jgi:Cu2+-exporting ATPase
VHTNPDPGLCYHCGEAVPPGIDFQVLINGQARAMCCPGCLAVAQLIAGSDLESFYQLRTEFSARPDTATAIDQHYGIYDEEDNRRDFVSVTDSGLSQARLLVTGISCAACTWLIEKSLLRLPGVTHAEVNLAQHCLTLCWEQQHTPLSQVFRQLESLGYSGHPWHAERGAQLMQQEQRLALRQLAVAGVAMMQVGMFAIALHAGDLQGMAGEYRSLLRWVSLLIATLVVFFSARPFFRSAWLNLRHGNLVMDLPVALAIGLAWSASAWATVRAEGQVYFDSVAMFTFFLLLARYLERRTRQRELLHQTDLPSLLPKSVSRRVDQGWENVPSMRLEVDDTVQLAPGNAIPADGRILAGSASVDEAAFSGEHAPRNLTEGDMAWAGTLLLEGSPLYRITAAGHATRVAQTLNLMNRSLQGKPRVELLADRIAAYFVGAVLLVAAAVSWYWWRQQPDQALWVCLSVLVVSCPCALALATPAALSRAATHLRSRGLVLLGKNSLQQLNSTDVVIFDKTGTLTHGSFSLQSSQVFGNLDVDTCLALAAALEQHSNHPAGQAFPVATLDILLENVANRPGEGVSGEYQQREVRIGSAGFCRQLNPLLTPCPAATGYWIALCDAGQTLAWFLLQDTLRPEAEALVNNLRQRGLRVELLTGDSSEQGAVVASQLSMDAQHSGQSPARKLEYIAALQAQGKHVTMVGDGLNDAPVLARADTSVAVSGATDLAKARADIIIVNPDLGSLDLCFSVALRATRIIRQNITWALAYNAMMIPLAASALVPPWAAAIGMSASSLLVVGNSMRLR